MTDSELMARLYHRIKRYSPEGGAPAGAIRDHSQACGIIAYLFDVHPDTVARAVKEYEPKRQADRIPT